MPAKKSHPKPSTIASVYASVIYYPTLAWNMFNGRLTGRWDWWNEVVEGVVLGAVPFSKDVAKLEQLGVRAVVNTCHEFFGHPELYQKHQITQHHMPTVDFTHPSLEDVRQAVDFMIQQIDQGKKVYVHCKAGRARSATVVICYLMKRMNLDPQSAQNLVLEKRKQVLKTVFKRPVVQEYYQSLTPEES